MDSFQPLTVSRRSSVAERQAALHQIYRQVLERQPYSFERQALAKAEKEFLDDKIGVRRFLRELGHSQVYLNAFYYRASNLKFLEWSFKHFMGRAPIDQDEVRLYSDMLMKRGVQSVITAILDSEEYRKFFGCFTVPYARQPQHYASPKAYLETQILNHEYVEQRGHIVPTIYWHELGLNCDAGVCSHSEAHAEIDSVSSTGELLQEQLLDLLKTLDAAEAREMIASLSPTQKRALRQAIRR